MNDMWKEDGSEERKPSAFFFSGNINSKVCHTKNGKNFALKTKK